jgi:hypothetical protein
MPARLFYSQADQYGFSLLWCFAAGMANYCALPPSLHLVDLQVDSGTKFAFSAVLFSILLSARPGPINISQCRDCRDAGLKFRLCLVTVAGSR